MFRFSRFFIDRPVFATVISLLILLGGVVSILFLPVDRYPQIVPPTVQISASYSGADAETVAESVAAPIEQLLSAVPNLLYFRSRSGNDGSLTITATFEVGTDEDIAAVDIQNRLSGSYSRLPEEVVRGGVEVSKSAPGLLAIVALESDDPRYDDVFLSNYAIVNILNALRREPGVGNVTIMGSRTYSMRIWVDPDKLTHLGMTMRDLVGAIRDQNNLYPAGAIADRPTDDVVELTLPIQTRGRLNEPSQYESIILRAFPDGRIVRLGDVAHIEMGSNTYDRVGRVNGSPTALMMVSQQVGANALDTMDNVRRALDELSEAFPAGVRYRIPYDTTDFISDSIGEVVWTLLEAVLLVILVVFLFLQSWRAMLIPLLAIPVSIVGAFAGMLLLGFSINTLTLFGLVLAIGIVVDDAIVVVENVERVMEEDGLDPHAATVKATDQVSGALVSMVLVLCAVFVPVAFMGGMTGLLYQQFAVTIAVAVGISGLVALTLSPALCRLILRPRRGEPRLGLLRWFNRAFERVTRRYTAGVRLMLRHAVVSLVVFGGVALLAYRMMDRVPTGFLPTEDQGFFSVAVLLPDGASMDRTDRALRHVEAFLQEHDAVDDVISVLGQDSLSGTTSSNGATLFVSLKPFAERRSASTGVQGVIDAITEEFADLRDGLVYAFHPPAVQGIGERAGFQLELQDRTSGAIGDLVAAGDAFVEAARERPAVAEVTRSARFGAPHVFVDVDRERAKVLGLNLGDVYDTLNTYLGSLYVNDFNMFGRVWRVRMQAASPYRDDPRDIERLFARNQRGQMVPLTAVVDASLRSGPNTVERFNGFNAIRVTGAPAPGYSTGEAMAALSSVARDVLPDGYAFDWSGASYQQVRAGQEAVIVILFGLIVIFLVLAALYERWLMPLGVLLVVPVAVFGAMIAIGCRTPQITRSRPRSRVVA